MDSIETISGWTVQTPARFTWRFIDFEFEGRSFRYMVAGNKWSDTLKTHSNSTPHDRAAAWQSALRVLAGLTWTTGLPFFTDSHGSRGAAVMGSGIARHHVKSRRWVIRAFSKYRRNSIVDHFALPEVPTVQAWKALSFYREAVAANETFHQAISFYKVLEVAHPKEKVREEWIRKNIEAAARFSSSNEIQLVGGTKEIAAGVGRNRSAHQNWVISHLPDYTRSHIIAHLHMRLAKIAIKDSLGIQRKKWIRHNLDKPTSRTKRQLRFL